MQKEKQIWKSFAKVMINLENKFSIKLVRKSDYDVGIGEAIYLSGTGRYKSLVDKMQICY